MKKIQTKYTVKIPKDINIIYSRTRKIITIVGPLTRKSLKLPVQLFLIKSENLLKVSSLSFFKASKYQEKRNSTLQGTITSLIRQLIIETSILLYKELKIVGVGYRVFDVDNFKNRLFLFKVGYSHFLFFKVSPNINLFCVKTTKLFVFGNSYQHITETASLIRSYKKPEIYKGKGILYKTEKIILKEGKKT